MSLNSASISTMPLGADFESIIDCLKSNNNFIVVTHISPDPDAIGSSVSLAIALRKLGKEASVFLPEIISEKFSKQLVPPGMIFDGGIEKLKQVLPSAVLVGIDCATKKRLGEEINQTFDLAKSSVNIDHHASNEKWANLNWVVTEAAASAMLAGEIIKSLNVSLTIEIANLLFAGLMDDTGSFRYSNTDQKALSVAADLVGSGADPSMVSSILYFQVPERVLRLRSAALSTLEVFGDGKISLLYVTDELLTKFNCTAEDTEGLVDLARSIEGVCVAFFIRQISSGYKISARSKDKNVDVNKFAANYGGGGHPAAAGFTIEKNLDQVLNILRTDGISLLK